MADSGESQKVQASSFEGQYYDEYDFYNLSDRHRTGTSRKGRSKKEASDNTNRFNPAGHERKLVSKLQQAEQKRK